MHKFSKYFLILMSALFISTGCDNSNDSAPSTPIPPPTVTSIQVTPGVATVPVGLSGQMLATAYLSDGGFLDVTDTAAWTSSNENVVTVDTNTAKATAIAAGTGIITATYESIAGDSTITVTTPTLDSISIDPLDESVPIDIEVQYSATGLFSDHTIFDMTELVTWESSVLSVSTIDAEGLASALAAGTTVITASYDVVSTTTTLNVNATTIVSLDITPYDSSIEEGGIERMILTALFSDGTTHDVTHDTTWVSSDPQIAQIENLTGKVTAVAPGTTEIKATYETSTATTFLNVFAATLESITVTPGLSQPDVGTPVQYKAIGLYSNNTTRDITKTVTWRSSNMTVATILSGPDNGGLADTIGVGFITITANVQNNPAVSGSATLNVLAGN